MTDDRIQNLFDAFDVEAAAIVAFVLGFLAQGPVVPDDLDGPELDLMIKADLIVSLYPGGERELRLSERGERLVARMKETI